MTLTVTGRRMAVTDATREQIDRKVRRLDRILHDRAVSAQCVLSEERQRFTCELTVQVSGGGPLHGVGRDARLITAVGDAVERVGQQAAKLADRSRSRRRGATPASAPVPAEADAAPRPGGRPARRLIRSHGYDIKPMNLDDAMLALEDSDRMFLVFRQAANERMAILFRRPDGHFGLIEPES